MNVKIIFYSNYMLLKEDIDYGIKHNYIKTCNLVIDNNICIGLTFSDCDYIFICYYDYENRVKQLIDIITNHNIIVCYFYNYHMTTTNIDYVVFWQYIKSIKTDLSIKEINFLFLDNNLNSIWKKLIFCFTKKRLG